MDFKLANPIAIYESRAREAVAKGERVMAMAICPNCHHRIPVIGYQTWIDVVDCNCPDMVPMHDRELTQIIFGDRPHLTQDMTANHLRRVD